jgi:hypothetical protein
VSSSKYCMIKVSVNQAWKIRDFNDSVIKDSPLKFRCVECGRAVRPYTKTENATAYFGHLRRNPDCSLSDSLAKRRLGKDWD